MLSNLLPPNLHPIKLTFISILIPQTILPHSYSNYPTLYLSNSIPPTFLAYHALAPLPFFPPTKKTDISA